MFRPSDASDDPVSAIFAYKDVTQAYVSSLSYGADAVQGDLTLILSVGIFWFSWSAIAKCRCFSGAAPGLSVARCLGRSGLSISI
jgi:hypothetical protein